MLLHDASFSQQFEAVRSGLNVKDTQFWSRRQLLAHSCSVAVTGDTLLPTQSPFPLTKPATAETSIFVLIGQCFFYQIMNKFPFNICAQMKRIVLYIGLSFLISLKLALQ